MIRLGFFSSLWAKGCIANLVLILAEEKIMFTKI